MKHYLLTVIALLGLCTGVNATDITTLSWADVCNGKMGAEWYGTDEAKAIADIVLDVQKTTGGWMKNDQLHKLTPDQLANLKASRAEHSCLDNAATTQEMRFLAKVWQATKVEKYRTAFTKGLDMIFTSEKSCGGWSQYWPLSGNGSYQDYITFNDDLVTNVMKLLRDINNNKGDFTNIADETIRTKCMTSFNKAIDVILKCQIDDNGVKAAWCAQHDPVDFLPAEGRPHELPSVSGYESADLISFLMTVEKPSTELQEAITAAVTWLDNHKIEGKAIEDFTNAKGEKDRRIIDKSGSAIWGRFIQIGGESGKKIYDKFFKKLEERGKKRTYNYNGVDYTYTENEIATSSYKAENAYKPIFSIYKNEYPHLFYRFLYNYADTDPVIDSKGVPVATSLMATNRASYQYLGSWCQKLISEEYPAWKKRIDATQGGEGEAFELSAVTYSEESTGDGLNTYHFNNGFTVSDAKGKGYGAGKNNTIKYSANAYDINIPEGKKVVKVTFTGYDNYDVDAYIKNVNGVNYSSTDYVFPAKVDDTYTTVSHSISFTEAPVEKKLSFSIGNKQCCLIIYVYCSSATGIEQITITPNKTSRKYVKNGKIIIEKGNKKYAINGHQI